VCFNVYLVFIKLKVFVYLVLFTLILQLKLAKMSNVAIGEINQV